MVRLHVTLAAVPEPAVRVAQDADMGIAAASARNPALVAGREARGYTRPSAANRCIRTTEDGQVSSSTCSPWHGAGIVSNQPYGDSMLDEIRGQSLATDSPASTSTYRDATPQHERVVHRRHTRHHFSLYLLNRDLARPAGVGACGLSGASRPGRDTRAHTHRPARLAPAPGR